ncbi:130_t:CDS:2, partial [Ambispora gerdemannii]
CLQGDGGRDLEGEITRTPIVFQLKDWEVRVCVDVVRDLEGILSRYPIETIGVLVTSRIDGFLG